VSAGRDRSDSNHRRSFVRRRLGCGGLNMTEQAGVRLMSARHKAWLGGWLGCGRNGHVSLAIMAVNAAVGTAREEFTIL